MSGWARKIDQGEMRSVATLMKISNAGVEIYKASARTR